MKGLSIMAFALAFFVFVCTCFSEAFVFQPKALNQGNELAWYCVDWGDGTLTPTSYGFPENSPRVLGKRWESEGVKKISTRAITLSGKVFDIGTRRQTVSAVEPPLQKIPAMRSAENKPGRKPYRPQSVSLAFQELTPIAQLTIQKADGTVFPDNFNIETSTDGGKTWQDVSACRWTTFPDPKETTVLIPLHGVVANQVRVISYNPPEQAENQFCLKLGEVVAYEQPFLFSMDSSPLMQADWNNMWLNFGSARSEICHDFNTTPTGRPDEGGHLAIFSTVWSHWNALKMSWNDFPENRQFELILNNIPQNEEGLMGACPVSFLHLGHSQHYVTPAIFIAGVSYWHLMHRDMSFLETKGDDGRTLLEKVRKAMRYQLENLKGESGVLTIMDPANGGPPDGKSSNYWDGWRFGYKSSYANIWFYMSLHWMAELEESLGNADEADRLRTLQKKVKAEFNKVFWSEKTGRFIGCEARDGKRYDYGFTFVNTEALAAGLATEAHAESILEWLDGDRLVRGDTSKGKDIYHFRIAPRANTVDAVEGDPTMWDDWALKVGPDTIGEYGTQIQNGGHIFYVSFYDLTGRLEYRGIQDAMKRMDVILEEYHKDHLHRKPNNKFGSTHFEGILREFPESGLVPLFFLTGIMGLEPCADGLMIEPSLPDDWNEASVSSYWFAGAERKLCVRRGLQLPRKEGEFLCVPADGEWVLIPEGKVVPK